MGELSEFKAPVRLFLKVYRWRRVDPVPWTPLRKPLAGSRLAIVSTAGMILPGQERFDERIRGGDVSYRVISGDTDPSDLIDTHRSDSFDHAGVAADANLGFPLDRVRECVERGRLGSLAPRNLSFMGSIVAPGRLVRDTAPQAARLLVEDEVDVALLVPV